MSLSHFIEKIIEIQDSTITKIEEIGDTKHIYVTHNVKEHVCPSCGARTKRVHDYREQAIRGLPAYGFKVVYHLRKRRYTCTECNKRFYEQTPYLTRYSRNTQRYDIKILDELRALRTYTDIAKEYGCSVSTVIRKFDIVSYPKPKLPVTVSIDEFKGNAGGEKYNCIVANPLKHEVIDILPKRHYVYLLDYFKKYPYEQRKNVNIFVSDMWTPFQNMAEVMMPNAMRVVDKYHWTRQITWAFERVRKDVQKHISPSYRRYFKRSRTLLLKSYESLDRTDQQAVNVMLYASADISTAHFYKEEFQKIMKSKTRAEAKRKMNEWIDSAIECGVKPIEDAAKSLAHWKKEILDSFTTSCTNGFIEGCNNKIKVLKRISYGCKNFERFRNRILHIFSNKSETYA